MAKLDLRVTDEMIRVLFTDYELMHVQNLMSRQQEYILRRIERAIHTERTRPWREVLGTDKE